MVVALMTGEQAGTLAGLESAERDALSGCTVREADP